MTDEPVAGKTRLSLDGDWGLLELSGFGRQYVQVYSFLYAIEYGAPPEDLDDDPFGFNRVLRAFRVFPWAGGWSSVGFYKSLQVSVPKEHRPRIVAIEYASPGYIELGVALPIAWALSGLVRHCCTSIKAVSETYYQIRKNAQELKLLRTKVGRADLELEREKLKFAEEAAERLGAAMDFKGMDDLRRLTDHPVVRLKILMSLFRRVRDLAKLQDSDQIKFDK